MVTLLTFLLQVTVFATLYEGDAGQPNWYDETEYPFKMVIARMKKSDNSLVYCYAVQASEPIRFKQTSTGDYMSQRISGSFGLYGFVRNIKGFGDDADWNSGSWHNTYGSVVDGEENYVKVIWANFDVYDENNNLVFDKNSAPMEFPDTLVVALPKEGSIINENNKRLLVASILENQSPFTWVDPYGYRVKMEKLTDGQIILDEKFTCALNQNNYLLNKYGILDTAYQSYSRFSINGILSDYYTIPLSKLEPNTDYIFTVYNSKEIFSTSVCSTGDYTSDSPSGGFDENSVGAMPKREQFNEGFEGDIQYFFSFLIWIITYPFVQVGILFESIGNGIASLFNGFDTFISRFKVFTDWLPKELVALIAVGFGFVIVKFVIKK